VNTKTELRNVIMLKNVRLAFPKLFKAEQVNGQGKPAYACAFLLADTHPQIDEINELIDKVGAEKWGNKAKGIVVQLRGADKVALHNGDNKAELDGYAGNYFINARTPTKPLVLDRDKTPLTEDDGKPYGGCYVNAAVQVWAQDNQFGKRINATLRWVQFLKDGDAFAGGTPASDDEVPDISDTGDEDIA
jgi:Protein of unknown function (DUF2815)